MEPPAGEQVLRLLREVRVPLTSREVAAMVREHPREEVLLALERLATARLIAREVRRREGRPELVYLDPLAVVDLWAICPRCRGTGRAGGDNCPECVPVLFAAPLNATGAGRMAARRRILAEQDEVRGIR